MSKKVIKKWSRSEEELFIEVWDEKLSELHGPKKNAIIYAEMAQKMSTNGVAMTNLDVKYKIHNLTSKYKKCKQSRITGSAPYSWHLYERVHKMIGAQVNLNENTVTFESVNYESQLDPISICHKPPSPIRLKPSSTAPLEDSPSSARNRNDNLLQYIAKVIVESTERKARDMEELKQFEKIKTQAIVDMASSAKELVNIFQNLTKDRKLNLGT